MAGFWASHELIRTYREYCAACKAENTPPMDCETFYWATKDGQQTLPPPQSTATADVSGGTEQAGR